MSALQTAITELQAAESNLAKAVKGYSGSVAGKTNDSVRNALVSERNIKSRVGRLRNQIENDGQSLILDWEHDVAIVNGEAFPISEVVDFTRSTGGGRIGPDGKYEWIPGTRTNLITWSNDFSDSNVWRKDGVSVAPNAGLAPDGSLTAWKLVPSSGTSRRRSLDRRTNITVEANQPYTLSVYMKAADAERAGMWFDGTGLVENPYYASSTVLHLKEGYASNGELKVDNGVLGWVRVSMTVTPTGTTFPFDIVAMLDESQSVNAIVGDDSSGILFWGFQLERGVKATEYIPTEGTAVTVTNNAPRITYDPVTGECLGLLVEEQSTNLFRHSESLDLWERNATTSVKEGTFLGLNAFRVTVSGDQGICRLRAPTFSLEAGKVCVTVYLKAGSISLARLLFDPVNGTYPGILLDLSTGAVTGTEGIAKVEKSVDGWWKVSMSATSNSAQTAGFSVLPGIPDANDPTAGDIGKSIFVCAPQCEQKEFPTSYIPTGAAAVTRGVDRPYITKYLPRRPFAFKTSVRGFGSTNNYPRLLQFDTGSNADRFSFTFTKTTGLLSISVANQAGTQAGLSFSDTNAYDGEFIELSCVVDENLQADLNGETETTRSFDQFPVIERISLLHQSGVECANGTIKYLELWPYAVPIERLIA